MKDKSKFKTIIHVSYILLITLLLFVALYARIEFKYEKMESYLFYLLNGMSKSDYSMILYALKKYGIPYILTVLALLIISTNIIKIKYMPIKKVLNHIVTFDVVLGILISALFLHNIGFFKFLYNNYKYSTIIDDNYKKIELNDISFDKKKNLVLVYIESLETSFHSKNNGGDWDKELLPRLLEVEKDKDSIYFSTNDKFKGALNLYGTTWTTAGVIASNSGIPFKIQLKEPYFDKSNMLNGVITLGDVLNNNGYHNEVVSGASTKFGGLQNFFENHGKYEIIDSDTIDKYSYKVDYDTSGRWGFNDRYMFDVAKQRMLEHVKNGTTFNETLIGIDTHPINGEKTDYMIEKFDKQYENSYLTEDMLLEEFVNWIKNQDFYKDTVIVILGDHQCMQTMFVKDHEMSNRGRYNLFINSSVKTNNNKNRSFTSLDIYPTVIASIGGKIKEDKIGLGTNLFSNNKTLTEELGYELVDNELQKNSKYYSSLLKE